MYTYLIGFVDEVRPNVRTDKKTGEVFRSVDLTVTFEAHDNENYLVKSTETIQFPFEKFDLFKTYKSKFIAIPYRFLNTKNGAYMFPDENLSAEIFENNPFFPKTKK